jgi:hypothetical protein
MLKKLKVQDLVILLFVIAIIVAHHFYLKEMNKPTIWPNHSKLEKIDSL